MDRVQVEDTPADQWKASLNATCNRLSTQYLNLLRSASSAAALQEHGAGGGDEASISHDPRSGGGIMRESNEPPPPLAADASLSALQTKLAAHNLCAASANLLDLIRTLRLSALLMDEEIIAAEEQEECEECHDVAEEAVRASVQLEAELMILRNDVDAGR